MNLFNTNIIDILFILVQDIMNISFENWNHVENRKFPRCL